MTKKFWKISESDEVSTSTNRLYDSRPLALNIENMREIVKFNHDRLGVVNGIPTRTNAFDVDPIGMPAPKLVILDSNFRHDYFFFMGLAFVSLALKNFLNLDEMVALFVNVDCGACPREVQAMGYHTLHTRCYANPLDPQRTGGIFTDITLPDGSPSQFWQHVPVDPPNFPDMRLAWREDFVPPAPMFRIPGTIWTMVTDELAERVMRARFRDMEFLDLTNDGTLMDPVLRRLTD